MWEQLDWQMLVVLVCIAAAIADLIRRAIGLMKPNSQAQSGCGSCGGCEKANADHSSAVPSPMLHTIQPLSPRLSTTSTPQS